jgi:hypothetical protein
MLLVSEAYAQPNEISLGNNQPEISVSLLSDLDGLASGNYGAGTVGLLVNITNSSLQNLSNGSLVLALPKSYSIVTAGFKATSAAALPHSEKIGNVAGMELEQIYIRQPENYHFYETSIPDLSQKKELKLKIILRMPNLYKPTADIVGYVRYTNVTGRMITCLATASLTSQYEYYWTRDRLINNSQFVPKTATIGEPVAYYYYLKNVGNGIALMNDFTMAVGNAFLYKGFKATKELRLNLQNNGKFQILKFAPFQIAPAEMFGISLALSPLTAGSTIISIGADGASLYSDFLSINKNETFEILAPGVQSTNLTPNEIAWSECRTLFSDEVKIKQCVREKLLTLMNK